RVDAEPLEIPELVRHDDRRTVRQRDDAEANALRFGRIVRKGGAHPPFWKAEAQGGGDARPSGALQKGSASELHLDRSFRVATCSPMKTYVNTRYGYV